MRPARRSSSEPSSLVLEGSRSRRPASALSRGETVAVWAVLLLVFLEHMAFGGGRREVALAFAALQGGLLCALVGFGSWTRDGLSRLSAFRIPAALYALSLAAAVWAMTPWVPGGPHPVWDYTSALPAAVLDRGGVLVELMGLLGLACVFVLAWLIGASDDRARRLLLLWTAATAIYAVWAFGAHLIDPQTIYGVVPKTTPASRLNGSFFSSNTTGTFLAAGTVIITASLMERLRGLGDPGVFSWERLFNRGAWRFAGLAFCIAATIMTASRTAVAAMAVSLIVLLVWEAIARRWRLLGAPGAALALVLVLLLGLLWIGGGSLFERLLNLSQDAEVRREITAVHWQAFLASRWMGYGLGSFDEINRLVTTSEHLPALWNVRATHNVYVQWFEEAGLLGAIPMFLAVAAVLVGIVLGSIRRTRLTTWLRAIVCVSLVYLIHGATDFAIQIPSMSAQWACLLGLGLSIAHRTGARR